MSGDFNGSVQSMPLEAGYADGFVIHHRLKPQPHRFKYNMCWCVFDLDQMGQWFDRSSLWGHNRWSIFGMNDRDYVKDDEQSIKAKLQQYIREKTDQEFDGKVLLFTHPRFLGYGFNSVNFYFCYRNTELGNKGTDLVYIISEINNTPWGEKHLYLHECDHAICKAGYLSFDFTKQFHISPFVAMDMQYTWRFKVNAKQIAVIMKVKQQDETLLSVVLDTKITRYVENKSHGFMVKRPFQPWKMSIGIYWQAFKLWCKRVPIFDHPKNKQKN